MRYSGIQRCEYINGNDIGVSLYIQGCSLHCPGCFNPETWDFDGGEEFTEEVYNKLVALLEKPYVMRFTVLGGEPLERYNWSELNRLLIRIRKEFPELDIWLYTGYDYEFLMELIDEWRIKWPNFNDAYMLESILEQVNVLVAGPFIKELKDRSLVFKGSSNQEIIVLHENNGE